MPRTAATVHTVTGYVDDPPPVGHWTLTTTKYYGPDFEQSITERTKEYCNDCEYWFKGPGSKRR